MKEIIDFHAHVLPGADHGSDSAETSLFQLKSLKEQGITSVVATPHFYPQRHSVEQFLKRREAARERLLSIRGEDIPRVYLGCEVLVCGGIDHMEGLERLCIEGTDVILLELPFSGIREEHAEAVYKISKMGLVPVLAHIDRYPEKDIVSLCRECGVMCQINAEAVSGFGAKKRLSRLFASCDIAAFGSDIHERDKSAAKRLAKLCAIAGEETERVMDTSKALLKNAVNIFE